MVHITTVLSPHLLGYELLEVLHIFHQQLNHLNLVSVEPLQVTVREQKVNVTPPPVRKTLQKDSVDAIALETIQVDMKDSVYCMQILASSDPEQWLRCLDEVEQEQDNEVYKDFDLGDDEEDFFTKSEHETDSEQETEEPVSEKETDTAENILFGKR
ncbi:hypothetical protein ILUMI_03725 [Ignelater luminosus]|uniref:Uncharacterized protein n=1 Tax=Ignelater luminosus TaxID=2038154 RepID=A0A8K0GF86_IGNLU|nr:hypothetical protein ILUMI_03725 [Ignelater luminosus]